MNKTYQELCDELKTANERIAELQAERDLHEAGEKLQLQLRVKANERENALLVHLDRLIEAWDELAATDAGTEANREAATKVTDLLCSTPAASVSRLVAEKQADALEEAAEALGNNAGGDIDYSDLIKLAESYRQKARGDQ